MVKVRVGAEVKAGVKVRVAQPHLVVVECPIRVRDEGRDVRGGGDELDQLRGEDLRIDGQAER